MLCKDVNDEESDSEDEDGVTLMPNQIQKESRAQYINNNGQTIIEQMEFEKEVNQTICMRFLTKF